MTHELQTLVTTSPDHGSQVLRKYFHELSEQGTYKDSKFLLHTNYKCLDDYSDNQRIVQLGILGTLYRGRIQAVSFTFTNKDDLNEVLELAYVKAGQTCDHDFSPE